MSIQGVIDALHTGCMKPACRASTPCCRMLHPAAGRRRRELTAAFQWRCPHLRVPCSLHAGFMSIAFLKCRSYFSKCSLHVARITPVCGMQDAAGCSWSGVFNLLKFDRIAKKKKKKKKYSNLANIIHWCGTLNPVVSKNNNSKTTEVPPTEHNYTNPVSQ